MDILRIWSRILIWSSEESNKKAKDERREYRENSRKPQLSKKDEQFQEPKIWRLALQMALILVKLFGNYGYDSIAALAAAAND